MVRLIVILLGILAGSQAYAQGTLNVALQQQFSFTGCSTAANVCGTPLIAGQLFFFAVGSTSTRQDSFQDPGLSILNPWPLTLDANGRVPMFYLASGSVHVRLTDASGVVQFDYPSMLVIGPSGGGGGGGPSVDPSTIAATGDIKFRLTGEALAGWVKLNGLTLGKAGSGASNANDQYQALYVYLYTNCPDAVCPLASGVRVVGNAVTDFNAGAAKIMTLPDLRSRALVGLDDMGNAAKGIIVAGSNMTGPLAGPPGATGTTLFGFGGENTHQQLAAEVGAHTHSTTITEPNGGQGHRHGPPAGSGGQFVGTGGFLSRIGTGTGQDFAFTDFATTGISVGVNANTPAATPFNVMGPFSLGTFYIKT